MTDTVVAIRSQVADVEGDFPMDDAVIDLFPPGTIVHSAESYGSSEWTQTGCVTVTLPEGEMKRFFLKLSFRELGERMLRGEYTSIALIHSLIPGLVPKPLGWGKFKAGFPETYFFIEDFLDMDFNVPDPDKLVRRMVELHKNVSPSGLFGFSVPSCAGRIPHVTDWEPSWTKFFVRFIRKTFETDEETNGHWSDLSRVFEHVMNVVAPRLLDPLQSGPDAIKPRLIHGDFWGGNIGTDAATGEIVFYDAGAYYAHNEMDLGMLRRGSYKPACLGQRYIREYQQLFPPSEPKEEFDDRNRLYSLKYNINYSAGHLNVIERE
ncbi:hypothetical protein G7054_g9840 [Neopestalotiopsis clavispora]|nr:hypothetical protein G7054_g9840 [Neopestalotiopsis clavispora]